MAVENPREGMAGNAQHLRCLSHVQAEWFQAILADAAPWMRGDGSSAGGCLLLVVVCQVDVTGISVLEAKGNPPVPGNRSAPVSLEISFQRVKPVAGQVEVRGPRASSRSASTKEMRLAQKLPVHMVAVSTAGRHPGSPARPCRPGWTTPRPSSRRCPSDQPTIRKTG